MSIASPPGFLRIPGRLIFQLQLAVLFSFYIVIYCGGDVQISAVTLDEEHQGRCGSHKDLSAAGWDDPKDGINSDRGGWPCEVCVL